MFVDIVDVVTDVYYRVNKYRGHLTVYPEMAKIITYIENKGNKQKNSYTLGDERDSNETSDVVTSTQPETSNKCPLNTARH